MSEEWIGKVQNILGENIPYETLMMDTQSNAFTKTKRTSQQN